MQLLQVQFCTVNMEPWNDSTLLAPPTLTSKIKTNFDLNELKRICNYIVKTLSKQSPLHREGAICSRFIYKFDKKFRHDIGYRYFRKTYTALKKYLTMNLIKDIEKFASMLPSDKDECYYPTRQMLEHVLVKLMTFSKIMLRINVCTKQSATFYLYKIKKGDAHWMCLMPYAVASRLWSISKVLLIHSTHWYTSLYTYLDKLQYKGLNFLPNDYTLPECIKVWLGLENIDNFGRFEWKQIKPIGLDPTLMNSEDADELINILGFVNQLNNDDNVNIEPETPVTGIANSKMLLKVPKTISTDQGEVVSRENFNVLQSFQNKMKYNKFKHNFEMITDVTSLTEFVDNEENFRNDNNKLSLTQHLSLMQWHALKKALFNACNIIGNGRKIQRKMEKIWKEKCLDYL